MAAIDRIAGFIEPLLDRGISAVEARDIRVFVDKQARSEDKRNELLAAVSEIYQPFFTDDGARKWRSMLGIDVRGERPVYPNGFLPTQKANDLRATLARRATELERSYIIVRDAKGSPFSVQARTASDHAIESRGQERSSIDWAELLTPKKCLELKLPPRALAAALERRDSGVVKHLAERLREHERVYGDGDGYLTDREMKSADATLRTIMARVYRAAERPRVATEHVEEFLPDALLSIFRTHHHRDAKALAPLFTMLARETVEGLANAHAESVLTGQMTAAELLERMGFGDSTARSRVRRMAPEAFPKPNVDEIAIIYRQFLDGTLSTMELYSSAQITSHQLARLRDRDPERFPLPDDWERKRGLGRFTSKAPDTVTLRTRVGKPETPAPKAEIKARAMGDLACEIAAANPFIARKPLVAELNKNASFVDRFGEVKPGAYSATASKHRPWFPNLRSRERWISALDELAHEVLGEHPDLNRDQLLAAIQETYPDAADWHLDVVAVSRPGLIPNARADAIERTEAEKIAIVRDALRLRAKDNSLSYEKIAAKLNGEHRAVTKELLWDLVPRFRAQVGDIGELPPARRSTFAHGSLPLKRIWSLLLRVTPPGTDLIPLRAAFDKQLEARGIEPYAQDGSDRRYKDMDDPGEHFAHLVADIVAEYARAAPQGARSSAVFDAVLNDYPQLTEHKLRHIRRQWAKQPERFPQVSAFQTGGTRGRQPVVGRGEIVESPRYLGGWNVERTLDNLSRAEREEWAELAQYTQIPFTLPLVDLVLERAGGGKPLAQNNILFVSHLLATSLAHVHAMKRAGARADTTVVVGTPYGSNKPVVSSLRDLELDVRVPPLTTTEDYEKEVEKGLDRIVALHRQNGDPIVVVDDGGLVTKLLHTKKKYADIIGAVKVVEQTTGGLNQIEHLQLKVPVINVARSLSKKLEGRFIGRAVAGKVMQGLERIGKDLRGKKAVVVGYGVVGRALAKQLQATGAEVTILETGENRRNEARDDGFAVGTPAAYSRADVVVGCTGKPSIKKEDLERMKSGVVVASASSKRYEVAMTELEESASARVVIESDTPGIELPTAKYTLGDRDITVLGDGWPVNFDGWVEGVPTDEIQLTIALMVAGALQASRTRNSERTNGLVQFDSELDHELMTAFKKQYGRKKPPVGDPASWKRIILDLAKSVA